MFPALRIPPAYIGFILFFTLLVFGFSNAPVLEDGDTAWHLATGDLIRSLHAVPKADSWSYTAAGETWYNLSWLFDLQLSFLFSLGGFSALYTLTVIVFSVSLTLMAWHCVRRGASIISVCLLLLPVIVIVFTGTLARPNVFSVPLTLIFYILLHRSRTDMRLGPLLFLVPLMALWVNLHGGFLMAFPLFGLFVMEAWLVGERNRVRIYLIITGLCLLATLANPYGFSVYYGAYRTLAAPFSSKLLEWQPVEIGKNVPVTIMTAIILCTGNFFDRKIPFADHALTVFILLMSLTSLRHSVLMSLLIMPCISLRLTTLLYESRFGERIRHRDNIIMSDMQEQGIRITAFVLALVAAINIYVPAYQHDLALRPQAEFSPMVFPKAEAEYVSNHYPGKHFFNSYNIGGYLDYIWRGRTKVFVDGRANSLYSDELLSDYAMFSETFGFGGRSEMIARKYHFDGLIIDNYDNAVFMWGWNPHWKAVYRGNTATVYVRADLVKPK